MVVTGDNDLLNRAVNLDQANTLPRQPGVTGFFESVESVEWGGGQKEGGGAERGGGNINEELPLSN